MSADVHAGDGSDLTRQTSIDVLLNLAFQGHAQLRCHDGSSSLSVAVYFQPHACVFYVAVPVGGVTVFGNFDDECLSPIFCLCDLRLESETALVLSAERTGPLYAPSLSELLHIAALGIPIMPRQSDVALQKFLDAWPGTVRCRIDPSELQFKFHLEGHCVPMSPNWQAVYEGGQADWGYFGPVLVAGKTITVRLLDVSPGVLQIESNAHLSDDEEASLVLALGLLHGSPLRRVCRLDNGANIIFQGLRKGRPRNALPMLRLSGEVANALPFMVEVLQAMKPAEFDDFQLACRFALEAKQADVPVELRFLMSMMVVEKLDGLWTLKPEGTSTLLGISEANATVLNSLRDELSHGRGKFSEAGVATQKKLNSKMMPDGDFAGVGRSGFDFAKLWLRLVERVDACLWVRLSPITESLRPRGFGTLAPMDLPKPYTKQTADEVKAKVEERSRKKSSPMQP